MLLKDKLKDRTLILASNSPRRREILAAAGIPFVSADSYGIDETWPEELPADRIAPYLASLKSASYPRPLAPGEILLTADTVVILGGEVLGKPCDRADALRMLGMLSGNRHRVITGVTLRNEARTETFSVESAVWFRELADGEIEYYVDNYSPMDKAGAYGIQEWIGYVGVSRIEGSFHNVMGMPMQAIYVHLEKFLDEQKMKDEK